MFSPRPKPSGLNSSFTTPIRNYDKRNSSLYAPKNKSFFSPLISGKNKSHNATEFQLTLNEQSTTEYKLSVHDSRLPPSIAEILSDFDGLSPKAKINNNGLAWVVSKDKLLLWSISSENQDDACYELQLPNMSDMVLIATMETNDDDISCLAVNSEGVAIFWSCVAYPRSFVEVKVMSGRGPSDLCVDLVTIADGFLIGWLSGTLTYIHEIQGQLKQTTMKSHQGRLTNISRRFSNMIFGSSQNSSAQIGYLKRLLPGDEVEDSNWALYVLLENQLQKWVISSPPTSEKLIYEINLDVMISNALENILGVEGQPVILQDIQMMRGGLSVLFATISNSITKHGIALLSTQSMEPPQSPSKIVMTDIESPLLRDGEAKTYKLLWPDRSSEVSCFFYNRESIVCFRDDEEGGSSSEVVNLSNYGAGCYRGVPLFLSTEGALVKVQESAIATNRSMADTLLKSKTFLNVDSSVLSSTSVMRLEELSNSDDPLTKFKAIFISNMYNASTNRQHNKTASMLSELFSNKGGETEPLVMDSLVMGLSREMIDDCPSGDPRWAESRTEMSVVSSSLILGHQLNDKLKAQEAFLNFLKANDIWDRLTLISLKQGQAPTCRVLCEHSEKLVAATTLKDIHQEWTEVVDPAMERCIEKRKSFVSAQGSLKPQDVFYKEVSRVHEIFQQLIEVERMRLAEENVETSQETLNFVGGVSAIFRDVLGKALTFRKAKAEFYSNLNQGKINYQGLKMADMWTSCDPVMMPLLRQHSILLNEVIPLVKDPMHSSSLFQDLMDITDLILDGLVSTIDSLGEWETSRKEDLLKKYEHVRTDLLIPFIQYKQYERALSLAEKYCHFELLVKICDEIGDECRLEEYMRRFNDQGFPEVVFDWYCKTGNRGKLFGPKVVGHPGLEEFLRRPENKFMSWIYDVMVKNYGSAHETLFSLAASEIDSIVKKRTQLSAAKLYAMLAEDPPFNTQERIRIIDNNLELICHQEKLFQNQGILEYLAIDSFATSRVYLPLELIDLQVGPCNEDADEFEFKKSFDLLKFCEVDDEDHPIRDILVDIWVKSILRDDWNFALSTTDPISSCQHTIFFKFMDLVLSEAVDLDSSVPSLEELLDHELMEPFHGDADFQCKLMIIYENARKMML